MFSAFYRTLILVGSVVLLSAGLVSCARSSLDSNDGDNRQNKLKKFREEMLVRRKEIDKRFPYQLPSPNASRVEVVTVSSDGVFLLADGKKIVADGVACDPQFYTDVFQGTKDQSAYIAIDSVREIEGGRVAARIFSVHQVGGSPEAAITADEIENGISSGICWPVESQSQFSVRYQALRREYLRSEDELSKIAKRGKNTGHP